MNKNPKAAKPAIASSDMTTARSSSRRAFMASMASVVLLAGCAGSGPRQPLPEVKKVRLLPVVPIDRLYTENKGVPIGVLWQALADRSKSSEFTQRMDSARLALADGFTEALQRELKSQGFDTSMMGGVDRPAGDPENVDYARLPGTEPVLHVYFSAVGMHSSRFSLDYLPRMNVEAVLVKPGMKHPIYEETIYYGADSRGTATWSVPSDPRFKWQSFDALIEKREQVVESYQVGVESLARQIARNIKAQVGG